LEKLRFFLGTDVENLAGVLFGKLGFLHI
jgi:hypothetical protein